MAIINFLAGKIVSLKDDGTVNAGGKVTFYVADGTFSTPITTYSNKALTTPNSSPIILDSAGRAKAYFSSNADVRYLTSADVLVYSERDVSPQNVKTVYSKSSSFAIDSSYTDSVIEITASLTATVASAATLGAGFSFTIVNTAAATSTLARANAGDTINGAVANLTIQANSSIEVTVNSGATGFLVDTIGVFPISVANGGTGSTTAGAARTALGTGGLVDNNTWTGTQTITGKALVQAQATLAAATTTNVLSADANSILMTGSGGAITITSFGTSRQAGAKYHVRSTGTSAHIITHNATSLICTSGANITVAQGDSWWIMDLGSNNCLLFNYTRANGTALVVSSINRQEFLSSGTWTKPSGYSSTSLVVIEAIGGGGGGGRGNAGAFSPGGGGGGGYSIVHHPLSAMGATETITIGAGGAGAPTNTNGSPGGNTTVGILLTAYGGGGGGGDGFVSSAGGGGGGDFGAGGSAAAATVGAGGIGIATTGGGTGGASGAVGTRPNSLYGGGGGGGSGSNGAQAHWGGGGGGGGNAATTGGSSINAGNGGDNTMNGQQPGGGGGGNHSNPAGNGGAGRVRITVYG